MEAAGEPAGTQSSGSRGLHVLQLSQRCLHQRKHLPRLPDLALCVLNQALSERGDPALLVNLKLVFGRLGYGFVAVLRGGGSVLCLEHLLALDLGLLQRQLRALHRLQRLDATREEVLRSLRISTVVLEQVGHLEVLLCGELHLMLGTRDVHLPRLPHHLGHDVRGVLSVGQVHHRHPDLLHPRHHRIPRPHLSNRGSLGITNHPEVVEDKGLLPLKELVLIHVLLERAVHALGHPLEETHCFVLLRLDLVRQVLVVLEEDLEILVLSQHGVRGQPNQKDLVHRHCLLEGREVFRLDLRLEFVQLFFWRVCVPVLQFGQLAVRR
eukprot:m.431048 g.431048  ORF g.431048 m.431048 type:complete len:324 (-) comp17248_c0_seq1:325-1296(-)